jgi:hypothetical protein
MWSCARTGSPLLESYSPTAHQSQETGEGKALPSRIYIIKKLLLTINIEDNIEDITFFVGKALAWAASRGRESDVLPDSPKEC